MRRRDLPDFRPEPPEPDDREDFAGAAFLRSATSLRPERAFRPPLFPDALMPDPALLIAT
jgi:hypothetical protein